MMIFVLTETNTPWEQERRMEIMATQVDVAAAWLIIGKDGPGRVVSPVTSEQELSGLQEKVRDNLVEVSRTNTACCGDGRCILCVASQAEANPSLLDGNETEETETLYQLFGGLYNATAHAAVLAGWSGLKKDAASFNTPMSQVGEVLSDKGYEDSAHTSNLAYNNPDKTECGFDEGFPSALAETLSGDLDPVLTTLAALSGKASFEDMTEEDKQLTAEILGEARTRVAQPNFYESYSAVKHRDELKTKNNGQNLSVVKSDHDETHGHHEKALVVVQKTGITVDQKALAQMEDQVFVYHQGYAKEIAATLAPTTARERRKLELAFDLSSVVIAHGKLFGPNMPVIVLS